MPITKKYRFTIAVASTPIESLELSWKALTSADFEAVTKSDDDWSLTGQYHPTFARLWGDIRVSVTSPDGVSTVLVLDVTSAVDNIYALAGSRGVALSRRFLDELAKLTMISSLEEVSLA
jgi:hypothetical protein